jgi:hypothetical protein
MPPRKLPAHAQILPFLIGCRLMLLDKEGSPAAKGNERDSGTFRPTPACY